MKYFCISLVAALFCLGIVGCDGSSAVTAEEEGPPTAYQFHHDVPKLNDSQTTCIVCGESPIKKELYADWGPGLRVYFDSKECKAKFEEDPEKYVNQFRAQEDEEVRKMKEEAMTPPEE